MGVCKAGRCWTGRLQLQFRSYVSIQRVLRHHRHVSASEGSRHNTNFWQGCRHAAALTCGFAAKDAVCDGRNPDGMSKTVDQCTQACDNCHQRIIFAPAYMLCCRPQSIFVSWLLLINSHGECGCCQMYLAWTWASGSCKIANPLT